MQTQELTALEELLGTVSWAVTADSMSEEHTSNIYTIV